MNRVDIRDHITPMALLECRELSQRALDVVDGFHGRPFTVEDFVSSAKYDGVTHWRDISIMLKHAFEIEGMQRVDSRSAPRAWVRTPALVGASKVQLDHV